MADKRDRCPHVSRCELVGQLRNESTLRFCQETYCHGEFRSCARYRHIEDQGSTPPPGLLPNGRRRSMTVTLTAPSGLPKRS